MKLLQVVPYKGSLPTAVPTDPLIYRFYELVNVYGTTIKELIHEEFGDGIMSAIDFKMDIEREPHDKGDRVLDHDVGQVPALQDLLTGHAGAGFRKRWMAWTTTEPSPTPEATRLTDPERTSPTA